jgi:hypothetical protein
VNFEKYVKCLITLEKENISDVDLVITDYITVDENGNRISESHFRIPSGKIKINEDTYSCIKNITHHAITYRTEILRKMNYHQTEKVMYSDQEWAKLPILAVRKYLYFPMQIYCYLMGRKGQSMEKEKFINNYPMQIILKKDMLCYLKSEIFKYPSENQKIALKFLMSSIRQVYIGYLMKYSNYLSKNEIVDFDLLLKENYPDIYNECDELPINKFLKNKFIYHWRYKKWRYELDYILYNVTSYIYHLIKR